MNSMKIFQAIFIGLVIVSNPVFSLPADAEAEAPVRTAGGSGLIRNGGFESGQLAPWTFMPRYKRNKAGYTITKPGIGGLYKFEYDARTRYDPGPEGPVSGFGIMQNVTAVTCQSYRISFRYLNQPFYGTKSSSTTVAVKVGAEYWRLRHAPKNMITSFQRNFTAATPTLLVSIFFEEDWPYNYATYQNSQLDDVHILPV